MAIITANGSKGKHKFTFEVEETQNIVETNKSIVTYTFKIAPIKSGYNWSGWGNYISYTLTVDGTNYTGTIPSYNGSSTVTLKTGTQEVPHNSDGTKTVAFSFSVTDTSGQSYTCGNASASGTQNMITIPRASKISSVASVNINTNTTIKLQKYSDSFKTTIYYKASGQNNWTKIVDKTSETNYTWKVPTSFYALIPNSKTISCQFYADTYSGSTLIGSSSTVTATFTATGNPTIPTRTGTDINSTTANLTGGTSTSTTKMVKYASNIRISVTATAQNSAYISKVTVNGSNMSLDGTSTSVTRSGTLTFNGATTNSFSIVATDSRGYSTTQNISNTLTMVNYVDLTLNATIVRNQPTDEKIKITYNGNYFNSSFGSQSNTLTVQYRYREKNGSWQSWTTLSPTKSGNTYSQTTTISGFDYTKQFEFQIRATDKIKSVPITGINVSKGQPVFWWNDEGLYVNGKETVSGDTTISGNLKTTSREDSNSAGWTYDAYGNMAHKSTSTTNTWSMKDGNGDYIVRMYPEETPKRFILYSPLTISGGGITTDATNSFQTTIFGSNNASYRIRPLRPSSSGVNTFGAGSYASTIAVSSGDTHGFLSVGYNTEVATIGGGNNDKINWKKELAFKDEVPTSGSNSNGYYIRFPNLKIQICYFTKNLATSSSTSSLATSGNVYYVQDTWTFPAAFSSAPIVTVGALDRASGVYGACSETPTTTNVVVTAYGPAANRATGYSAVAIGPYS